MSSPCERFFAILELVNLLTPYLHHKDVSHLSRTSKRTHHSCIPSLYRSLQAFGSCCRPTIFSSIPSLHALTRNVHHVRILGLETDELAFYYLCALRFEEIHSGKTATPSARLTWSPPLDTRTHRVIALPPMNSLSELTLRLGVSKNWTCNYRLPSAQNPRATLAQLCWLISINPRLTVLDLQCVLVNDLQAGRYLARFIAELSMIRRLELGIIYSGDDRFELESLLLFCCQSSIQQLSVTLSPDENSDAAQSQSNLWQEEGEGVMTVVPRREEPMAKLEVLKAHFLRNWHSAADIYSILSHCPNIKKLEVTMAVGQDADVIGRMIAQECPKIVSLAYGDVSLTVHNPLPFKILDFLPAQQVTEFIYGGRFSNIVVPEVNMSLQRHSTTLRRIVVQGDRSLRAMSASFFLSECANLEILHIISSHSTGHYVTLANVVEATPWRCTKLRELVLSISGCEVPVANRLLPYYCRPSPVVLTAAETQHFARLETLYIQIGKLTSLQTLGLKMITLDRHGRVDVEALGEPMSFPAMLSTGDTFEGRPGYLCHLDGLSRLEILEGSVRVDTVETKLTVDWAEAKWMNKHWPLLRRAEFFSRAEHMTHPFKWLRDLRTGNRERLDLGR
ncbi:hypothetical protein BGZ96_009812 [Linnemannia gamsii]|uniref:F-box domain-containing protein n=1 Tax=Linnemannia gamsii TaxID=64522 RepID=A0ABQ7JVZ5_9FUNG|nr:hypothetical protein BGZ96_009812 [Linnemannia gamsii]